MHESISHKLPFPHLYNGVPVSGRFTSALRYLFNPLCLVSLAVVQEKLKALVWQSQAFQDNPSEMEALWSSCGDRMYSLEERQKQLGLGDKVGELSTLARSHSQTRRRGTYILFMPSCP